MKINELIIESLGLNRNKVRAALWHEWQQDAWAGDEQSPEELDDDDFNDFEKEVDHIVAWGNDNGITSAALAVAKYIVAGDQSTIAAINSTQGLSESANTLNKLHNPEEYNRALKSFAVHYMVTKKQAAQYVDQYSNTVDNLISKGGTVYRALWMKPGKKPDLKNAGKHWTISIDSAKEYLESNAGMDSYGDISDLGVEPVSVIIAATVGPNNITNKNVPIVEFPGEQEVSIINPNQVKYKVVKS